MSKLTRAGLEAITAIIITLGIVVGAFAMMFGLENLFALSGVYYVAWALAILISHLVLARRRRHLRLGLGVAISTAVMLVHLVMYLTHNVATEINVVPVILHDFGFALISLITLNVVHLVIFRRRAPKAASAQPVATQPTLTASDDPTNPAPAAAPISPSASERVDDVPAPREKPRENESRQTA